MIDVNSLTVCKDTRSDGCPTLTIVICSYNQGQYVAEAVAAANKVRALVNAELLFIDDGSKDNSILEALNSLSESANYLVVTKTNSGLVHSLNSALLLARAEFVVFIAADDKLREDGVAAACERLARTPSAKFFLGNALYFGDVPMTRPVYGLRHMRFFASDPQARSPATPSGLPSPLLLQATVYRTAYLRQLNGWDADIVLDDLPMFMRMFAARPESGKDFIFDIDLMVSDYRLHTAGNSRRLINQYRMCEQCIVRYCEASCQRHEIVKVLAVYMLNALRARDVDALKFLASAALRARITTATIRQMATHLSGKLLAKLDSGR